MANIDFYYPFDSIGGDRKTVAATERRFFNALFSSGVVGADPFQITATSAGVYSVGAGVAIIGGAIGGIVNAKSITAKPAQGAKLYIVLRLDTTSAARKITLEAVSALENDSQAQLDQGGKLDLILYSVEGLAGGAFGLLDQRSYCTSFDNQQYYALFDAMLAAMGKENEQQLNALVQQLESIVEQANTEITGMFGAAGRQGFINPCFTVNQRGKSTYSVTAGTAYTFDRWLARIGGREVSQPVTIQRQAMGARNTLKIGTYPYSGTSGAGASAIAQNIEGGVRTFCNAGKQFTVSFDAVAATAQRLSVEPVQFAQAGGAGVAITPKTVEVTTAWQRFSLTFTGTVELTAEQMEDVLKVAFFFAWTGYPDRFGSEQNIVNTIHIANMQINEGPSVLPCYCKPYADELEACKRYFVALGFTSLAVSAQNASTRQVHTSPLPLTRTMRTAPAVSFTDRADVAGVASAEVAAGAWRNGLICATSANAKDNPVFTVTNTDAAEITRVCFNSVTLNAELMD